MQRAIHQKARAHFARVRIKIVNHERELEMDLVDIDIGGCEREAAHRSTCLEHSVFYDMNRKEMSHIAIQ